MELQKILEKLSILQETKFFLMSQQTIGFTFLPTDTKVMGYSIFLLLKVTRSRTWENL